MKHAIFFHPGQTPERMLLDVVTKLDPREVRVLKSKTTFVVDLGDVQRKESFTLWHAREAHEIPKGVTLPQAVFKMDALGATQAPEWQLSKDFPYTQFDVHDLRYAYVLARRIIHRIEDEMVLQLPLAPFTGLVQTFDVSVDVPKEITNFEPFRRAILVRPR